MVASVDQHINDANATCIGGHCLPFLVENILIRKVDCMNNRNNKIIHVFWHSYEQHRTSWFLLKTNQSNWAILQTTQMTIYTWSNTPSSNRLKIYTGSSYIQTLNILNIMIDKRCALKEKQQAIKYRIPYQFNPVRVWMPSMKYCKAAIWKKESAAAAATSLTTGPCEATTSTLLSMRTPATSVM